MKIVAVGFRVTTDIKEQYKKACRRMGMSMKTPLIRAMLETIKLYKGTKP